MPLIQFANVAVANGTATPLTGSQYEYLPWPAAIEIALNASVTGEHVATITSGSDVLAEEFPVPVVTVANVPPAFDQPMLTDIAAAGDRLKISLREIAGNTGTVCGWVKITPLV